MLRLAPQAPSLWLARVDLIMLIFIIVYCYYSCVLHQVDPSVSFDQVGGLNHYIKALKEMVFLPLVYPELFERFHLSPPRGVLFYGPPGKATPPIWTPLLSQWCPVLTNCTHLPRQTLLCIHHTELALGLEHYRCPAGVHLHLCISMLMHRPVLACRPFDSALTAKLWLLM